MEFDVRHTAKLARLHVAENEVETLSKEMEGIMEMMKDLPELTGKDALLDVTDTMSLREDTVAPSMERDLILGNAPNSADGYFVVPKTVE